MNLLIKRLKEDHKHFIGVIYHLEREIKAYSGLLRTVSNLDSILDILDYIKVYPQIWHYPIEDIIYEVLLEKDIPTPAVVADLMQQHAILDMLTESLHQVFNAISRGENVPIVRLIQRTSKFVQRQLEHINQEQQIFFPLVDRYLNTNDWAEVQSRLRGRINVASEVTRQEYKTLYRNITSASALTVF